MELGIEMIISEVQQKRHKQNLRLHHGQIISTRRPNRVLTRRIAVALGIDQRIDAESVFTSRTFAEVMEWLDVSFEEEVVTTAQHDLKRTVDMLKINLKVATTRICY
ncbi:hypothetical protein DPMN_124108 [Dreissena polymorpha]|uniref:Uncharacterized protein n=1 Tax=Dreissena polymorpha TaxID=45954 RepID=A0A9D4GRL6_DREPO|nr:hypothetical protein DPMN_124108 [Dreissena polymorpha]